MKKKNFLIIAAVMCIAFTAAALSFIKCQANYLDGVNTIVVVAGTNKNANVILAASTNFFNLPGQTSTNQFPPCELIDQQDLTTFRTLDIQHYFTCTASNGANVTLRIAGSLDRSNWKSNVFVQTLLAAGTASAGDATNFDALPWPYLAIQQIENPGPAAVTNEFLNSGHKPGL